jgi:hypothetical protein
MPSYGGAVRSPRYVCGSVLLWLRAAAGRARGGACEIAIGATLLKSVSWHPVGPGDAEEL